MSKSSHKSKVIIVGGGIIGSALAYFLSLKNISTTLLEKEFIGSGASGLSAGTLWCPLYHTGHVDLKNKSINTIDTLCAGSTTIIKNIQKKENVDYHQTGLLYPGFTLLDKSGL